MSKLVSKLLDTVRDSMRLKRYSSSTIESYTNWILRFILYHNKRHPREMGKAEISAFLSYLAKEKRVAGSTQNQALQAILYLYKQVLQIEIGNIDFARNQGQTLPHDSNPPRSAEYPRSNAR